VLLRNPETSEKFGQEIMVTQGMVITENFIKRVKILDFNTGG